MQIDRLYLNFFRGKIKGEKKSRYTRLARNTDIPLKRLPNILVCIILQSARQSKELKMNKKTDQSSLDKKEGSIIKKTFCNYRII